MVFVNFPNNDFVVSDSGRSGFMAGLGSSTEDFDGGGVVLSGFGGGLKLSTNHADKRDPRSSGFFVLLPNAGG